MESKQYATKQWMDHWRNQKRNKKYLETNEIEKTILQNLWNTAKAVLRRTFIIIQAYLRNLDKSQIDNLILHLQVLKKKKKNQISKTEVIKIRAEINGLETKKTIEKINESRSRFIGKISKIEKLLARLVKKKRVWPQVNKIRNWKEVTTNTTEIQKIIGVYYEIMHQ